MIRKNAKPQGIIGKTFMQRALYSCKSNLFSPVFKNGTNTVSLLHTITTDVKRIPFLHILFEAFGHHIKVFMEYRLGRCIERHRSIRSSGWFVTELHTAKVQRTKRKLTSINQLSIQSNTTTFFRFAGSNRLWGKCFIVYSLNTFTQPKQITHCQYSIRRQKIQEGNHTACIPLFQTTAQIRHDNNTVFPFFRKLRFYFKRTNTFYFITKKVYTIWKFGRERKYINDTTTYSILPRFIDIVHILKTIATQDFRNKIRIHIFPCMQFQSFISQFLPGNHLFCQSIGISHNTKSFLSFL